MSYLAQMNVQLDRESIEKVWEWFCEKKECVFDISEIVKGLGSVMEDKNEAGLCFVWLVKHGYVNVIEREEGGLTVIVRPTIAELWQGSGDPYDIVKAFDAVGTELRTNGEDIHITGDIREEERQLLEENKEALVALLVDQGKMAYKGTEVKH